MSEKSQRIRPETLEWLQDRYEQDVLLLVNNPDAFCDSEIRKEMDNEICVQYRILESVGKDINFSFWAVVENFLERDNPKSVERVDRLKKIVLGGVPDDVAKS